MLNKWIVLVYKVILVISCLKSELSCICVLVNVAKYLETEVGKQNRPLKKM